MALHPHEEQFASPLWPAPSIDDDPIRRLLNQRVPWITHGSTFSNQAIGTGPWQDQGWKIHLSATPNSAVGVLSAALDVLLAEGARFKVVSSVRQLAAMNSGMYAIHQIGKFITVYPGDDEQAVRLATELDRVTEGQAGPRVPTDRTLRPGSVVHYRYGAMSQRPDAEMTENLYGLLDPDGRLTHDTRLNFYQPPHPDISDPFEVAGVRVAPPARSRLLKGRYFVTDALAQSTRGGVFRAIDIAAQPPGLCLIKESWHDVALDPHGRDARDWARNEEAILTRYDDDPVLPRCFDSFEIDGDRYLVIEYIEGATVESALTSRESMDDRIDAAEVVATGLATADMLAHLHDIGLVFRDLKPANIVKTPDGGYRLIDFGIAYEYRAGNGRPLSIGTPPFYSMEQYEGRRPSPADDIFTWGAVLHYLVAGPASIADRSEGDDFLKPFPRQPLAEICSLPTEIADVIDRAVAWDRKDRYQTMREAYSALAGASHSSKKRTDIKIRTETRPRDHPGPNRGDLGPAVLDLARKVGDALCDEAEEHAGGVRWKRRFQFTDEVEYSPDIYGGAAGVGLFLAELAHTTGDERYATTARAAARWLGGPVWGRGRAQHGFHCGESGLAYFFSRMAELLDEPGYIDAAAMRLRRLRGALCHTADVMYGTAGTLLGSISLYSATGASEFLRDACEAADRLVSTRIEAPEGSRGCFWEIASPNPSGYVARSLGLLHGSAGLGLALAHLAAVTGNESYLDIAASAADLLLLQATATRGSVPAVGSPSDDAALIWPRHLGDASHGVQAHCHGAGGIGQFMIVLNRLRPDDRYRKAAEGAARAIVGRAASERCSGVCHGLSGAGHFLLDVYQASNDPQWLQCAQNCANRLQEFHVPEKQGIYTIDRQKAVSPDLMIGYAGVGSLLLRLSDPERAPDLMLGRLLSEGRR